MTVFKQPDSEYDRIPGQPGAVIPSRKYIETNEYGKINAGWIGDILGYAGRHLEEIVGQVFGKTAVPPVPKPTVPKPKETAKLLNMLTYNGLQPIAVPVESRALKVYPIEM